MLKARFTRNRLLTMAAMAALALCLVLVACGGDDEEDPPDNGETTDTPGVQTGTPTPVISIGGEEGSFEQLAGEYVNGVDGVVKYDVKSENFGFHPVGTWATYRSGDDIREDWTTNNFGYDETTSAYLTSEGMSVCTATPFSVSCVPASEIKDLEIVLILFTPVKDLPITLLSENGPRYEVEVLPDETIAEIEAKCFDVAVAGRVGEGPPGTEQIKMCFSDEGTLLSYDRVVTFESDSFEPARLTLVAEEAREIAEQDLKPPQRESLPTASPAGG
jgi:hypothetical protein